MVCSLTLSITITRLSVSQPEIWQNGTVDSGHWNQIMNFGIHILMVHIRPAISFGSARVVISFLGFEFLYFLYHWLGSEVDLVAKCKKLTLWQKILWAWTIDVKYSPWRDNNGSVEACDILYCCQFYHILFTAAVEHVSFPSVLLDYRYLFQWLTSFLKCRLFSQWLNKWRLKKKTSDIRWS